MAGRARIWDGAAAPLATAEAEQSAPRALVIDRDNLHRMIICRAADKAGYIPAGAANLAEATRLLQSGTFACITLDLSLREAHEFLSRLDAIACTAKIFLVGHPDAVESREGLRTATLLGLDVEKPMAKPLDVGLLRFALEQLKIGRVLRRGLAPADA